MPTINKEVTIARAEKRHATLGLYTPKEVAEMFGFDERTMAIWRSKKEGPRYTKLGKNVYYKIADIHAWIDANAVETGNTTNLPAQEAFDLFPPCDCCKPEAATTEAGTTEAGFAASEALVTVSTPGVEAA